MKEVGKMNLLGKKWYLIRVDLIEVVFKKKLEEVWHSK